MNVSKRLAMWLTALYLAVMVGLAMAPSAFAAGPTSTNAAATCDLASSVSNDVNSTVGDYLPVNRWANSLPLHSRLPGLTDVGVWGTNLERVATSNAMQIGNAAWRIATITTEQSQRFCIGQEVGHQADAAAAALGKAIMDSGLLAVGIVVALLAILWRARRNGFLVQAFTRVVLTAGLAGVLISGAMASNGSGYGVGSPAWLTTTTNNIVQNASAGPIETFSESVKAAMPKQVDIKKDPRMKGETSVTDSGSQCETYIKGLTKLYHDGFSEKSTSAGTSMAGSIAPQTLNDMWLQSGYATWIAIQFGPTAEDPYGPMVGCRLLDYSSNHSGQSLVDTMKAADPGSIPGDAKPEALAFQAYGDNNQIDQAMVGWAACNGSSPKSDWSGDKIAVRDVDCKNFFGQSRLEWWDGNNMLDFGDDMKANMTRTDGSSSIQAYILYLHGNHSGAALATAFAYVISSVVAGGIFTLLGIVVFIAKAALLVLAVIAIPVLVAGVFTAARPSSNDALGNLLKHFVVLSFFAWATSALLAVVSLLTSIISGVGSGALGDGTLGSALWVGFAPVISLVLLDQVFKRLLKAPSPFSMKGAAAWGVAAAGTGFLAGNAFNRSGQVASAIDGLRNRATNAVTGNMPSMPGSQARAKRTGAMAPASDTEASRVRQDQTTGATASELAGAAQFAADKKADAKSEAKDARKLARQGGQEVPTTDAEGNPRSKLSRAKESAKLQAGTAAGAVKRAPGAAAGAVRTGASKAKNAAAHPVATTKRGAKAFGAAMASDLGKAAPNIKANGAAARAEAKKSMAQAFDKFRDKPIRNTAKLVGLGAVATMAAGALPAAGVLAAVGAHQSWKAHRGNVNKAKTERETLRKNAGLTRSQFKAAQGSMAAYRTKVREEAPAPQPEAATVKPEAREGGMEDQVTENVQVPVEGGRNDQSVVQGTPAAGYTNPGAAESELHYTPPETIAQAHQAELAGAMPAAGHVPEPGEFRRPGVEAAAGPAPVEFRHPGIAGGYRPPNVTGEGSGVPAAGRAPLPDSTPSRRPGLDNSSTTGAAQGLSARPSAGSAPSSNVRPTASSGKPAVARVAQGSNIPPARKHGGSQPPSGTPKATGSNTPPARKPGGTQHAGSTPKAPGASTPPARKPGATQPAASKPTASAVSTQPPASPPKATGASAQPARKPSGPQPAATKARTSQPAQAPAAERPRTRSSQGPAVDNSAGAQRAAQRSVPRTQTEKPRRATSGDNVRRMGTNR